MRISIRDFVKELLENEYLIVNYNELNNGGFDLSVRINNEALNREEQKTDVPYDKGAEDYLKKVSGEYNSIQCPNCQKEFDKIRS